MAEMFFMKGPGGVLVPHEEDDIKKVHTWKIGDLIRVKATKVRNPQFHRKFFKMISVVWENQEAFTEKEIFRKKVLMLAGFCDIVLIDGQAYLETKSISFANMGETEFREVYDRVLDILVSEYCHGSTPEEIRERVNELVPFM